MDASGNVISPASSVKNFTHASGNKEYETILTADQAAEYAIDKVFPDWKPEEIAAQSLYQENEELAGNVYLVDGKIYAGSLPEGTGIKVRKANARGGFGPEVTVDYSAGIDDVTVNAGSVVSTEYYNLQGVRVDALYEGVVVKVDTLDNGKKISVTGLFVAIGSLPAADLIEKYVQRDENGYVIAGEDGLTSSSGLFVAGDVRTKKLRQVITAVSDGANAAASAIHYLKFCRKR